MNVSRDLLGLVLAASLLAPSFVAQAQQFETPAEEEEQQRLGIEEITVTAERRETAAQSTPVAVSAFTGTFLDDQGYYNFEDVSTFVPNIQFGRTLVGSGGITIRGVSSSAGDRATAFHVDGIYVNRSSAAEGITFYDVQRVEVLRGPQGTLYGRNATGGSINVITNPPGPDFEVLGDIQFGTYDQILPRLALNIPIIEDRLFFRSSFVSEIRNGFQRNEFTSDRSQDADDANQWAIRNQLRFLPTDSLDLTVRYMYSRQTAVGPGQKILGPHPSSVDLGGLDVDLYCTSAAAQASGCFVHPNPANNRRIWLDTIGIADNWDNTVNGQLVWDVPEIAFLGETRAKVVGSWLERHASGVSDQDGSDGNYIDTVETVTTRYDRIPNPASPVGYDLVPDSGCLSTEMLDITPGAPGDPSYTLQEAERAAGCDRGYSLLEEIVVEAQWASAGEGIPLEGPASMEGLSGNLDWILGVFYLNASSSDNLLATTAALPWVMDSPFGPLGAFLRGWKTPVLDSRTNDAQSWAVFGEADYSMGQNTDSVWDNWTLTFGLRYTHDEKEATRQTPNVEILGNVVQGVIDITSGSPGASESWNAVTGEAIAQWDWSDQNMVYFKGARGYKAGVINTSLVNDEDPSTTVPNADPEYVWAFEAASKNRFWENRVQANLTGFYYKYKDLQVSQLNNVSIVTQNSPDATIWGIEAEFVARPLDDYVDDFWTGLQLIANFGYLSATYDSFQDCLLPEAGENIDCSGNTLVRAPPYTVTLILDWPFDFGRFGTLAPNVQFFASGKVWYRPTNCPENPNCAAALDPLGIPVNDDFQDPYHLWDIRLTWTSEDGQFSVAGFVDNVSDKDVIQSQVTGSNQIGSPIQVRFDRPRTAGIRLGMQF